MKISIVSIWFLASLIVTVASNSNAQTQQVFDQRNVTNLIKTVKDFTKVWYKEKRENKFWNFVSKRSHLKSELGSRAFDGAFSGEPKDADTSTLKISFQIYESVLKGESLVGKVTLPLNLYTKSGKWDVFPDGFAIFPGNDTVLGEIRGDLFHTLEDIEKAKDGGLVPRQNYLLVLYDVEGDGYIKEELFTFWVKENNKWKLFSFFGGN